VAVLLLNSQSRCTTGANGLLALVLERALPPNFLDVSCCLTRGHISWRGGGPRGWVYIAAGADEGRTEVSDY
jgi:hypothetical protein